MHSGFLVGAGWGSRNPVSSLENLHINRYTNPADLLTEVIVSHPIHHGAR